MRAYVAMQELKVLKVYDLVAEFVEIGGRRLGDQNI